MRRNGTPDSNRFRVVIAGGGVAAVEAMVALRELAGDLVDVELVAPEAEFVYQPLAVAEPFDRGTAQRFPLAALANACGARLRVDALARVEPAARRARTRRLVELDYDALLVAVGARAREAVPGALTFRGARDVEALRALIRDVEEERIDDVVFAIPSGSGWPLPLYELALLTADRIRAARQERASVRLVTPEEMPLEIFGRTASGRVRALLDESGIDVITEAHPYTFEDGRLRLSGDGDIAADAVVALPSLRGELIAGIPHDRDDFIGTDPYGRVEGVASVYAAGDCTAFPVKQGGLATQQADAAAERIAADAGADVKPRPFEPVLRGVVITGGTPTYLRAEIRDGLAELSDADGEPLWRPAAKITGRYLGPFLAEQAGLVFRQRPRFGDQRHAG